MSNQTKIRDPRYLKAWRVFSEPKSARDLILILEGELNASSVYDSRMKMLSSLKKRFPPKNKDKFFNFIESERNRLGLKWSTKLKDYDFPKNGIILDIMCGTGKVGNLFYQYLSGIGKSPKLIYSDLSKKMLLNIESEIENSEKICLDVRKMDGIKDSSINLIVCRYGFNNLSESDWHKALSEVLRVLVPGGLFIIQDYFVPGKFFSSFINTSEYFMAQIEGRDDKPFIFSTEELNVLLDSHSLVASRYHTGHSISPNQKSRLKLKSDFQGINFSENWKKYKEYTKGLVPLLYHLFTEEIEKVPVYNITYGIRKKF